MNKATDWTRFFGAVVALNMNTGGRKTPEEIAELYAPSYFHFLADLGIEEVVAAMEKCILEGDGWFPAVSTIRKVVKDPHALLAPDERKKALQRDRDARTAGFRDHAHYLAVTSGKEPAPPPPAAPPRALGGHEPGDLDDDAPPLADRIRSWAEERARQDQSERPKDKGPMTIARMEAEGRTMRMTPEPGSTPDPKGQKPPAAEPDDDEVPF